MSTLEPQTSAKVRLTTTKGAIDIELWAKETPITSRAFLTNVLNGKFDGWQFNRIVDGFLVQIDGELNQEPFADEFNTRIRYVKRGIIGSVNLGSRNSNTGNFFITLKETPELQNKNTAFGKVVGDGIYTVLRITEGEKNGDGETPLYPVTVVNSEVLIPYFDDLVKEEQVVIQHIVKSDKKTKKKKLKVKLSLGDDDEEEDETATIRIKMKSAHDVLNDKKLAKEKVAPVIEEQSQRDKNTGQQSLGDFGDAIQEIQKRDDKLDKVKEEVQKLKSDLHQSTEEDGQQHQQHQSVIDKQRQEYLSKNTQLKISDKHSKEARELETLKLLQTFQQKMHTTKSKESEVTKATKEATEAEFDDDFDNLDDTDSDSDIYSHALKFDDNEENKNMVNEDLLVTIDESRQGELKKRRNDDYYRSVDTNSISTKTQKK